MNEWIIGAPWRKELLQGAPAIPRRRSAGNAESSTVYLTEGGGEQRIPEASSRRTRRRQKAGQGERSGGGRLVGFCCGKALHPCPYPLLLPRVCVLFQAWKVPAPSMMPGWFRGSSFQAASWGVRATPKPASGLSGYKCWCEGWRALMPPTPLQLELNITCWNTKCSIT